MAEKNIFCVGGYRFGSEEDAKLAELELKKSAYFEERLEGRGVNNLLSVYDKIIDEKVFATPVGWEYLRELQARLKSAGMPEEKIRPIPMYVVFAHKEEKGSLLIDRIRPTRKKSKDKRYFQISFLVNIFLVVLVIAMFVITIKSDNPNILNYKKAITNQYASWEQELTEWEQELREKEAELLNQQTEGENQKN